MNYANPRGIFRNMSREEALERVPSSRRKSRKSKSDWKLVFNKKKKKVS